MTGLFDQQDTFIDYEGVAPNRGQACPPHVFFLHCIVRIDDSSFPFLSVQTRSCKEGLVGIVPGGPTDHFEPSGLRTNEDKYQGSENACR